MNSLKRTLAGIFAVSMLLTLPSCSSNENGGPSKTATPQKADQVLQRSYQAIEMDCDIDIDYIETIAPIGNTGKYVIAGSCYDERSSSNKLLITDSQFMDITEIDFDPSESGNSDSYYSIAVTSDGTIYALVTVNDYGDMELPDWSDPDFKSEEFDYDAFERNRKTLYKLYAIDENGSIVSKNDVTGLEKYNIGTGEEDDGTYLSNRPIPCGNSLILTIEDMNSAHYVILGSDGKIGDEIDLGDTTWIGTSGLDRDGNLIFMTWNEDGEVLKTIDKDTLKLSSDDISLSGSDLNNARAVVPGSGDYRAYISATTSFFGIKDDGTIEEVINWVDSDMNGQYINAIVPAEEGDFIVAENNYTQSDNTTVFYRLTKRDASELANTTIISMIVSYADGQVVDKVKKFNQSHTDYRIKIEDYSKYYEWDNESEKQLNSPEMQLKMDIASGKTFDIYCLGDGSLFANLASKGAFADLYPFMENSDVFKKEDIVDSVLRTCEVDGKLVRISPTFQVSTMAIKKKFMDKDKWTFDEMKALFDTLPDDVRPFSYCTTKSSTFSSLMNSSSDAFIDFQKGTCSFDSDEFIGLLEFCKNLGSLEDEERNWDSMTDDERDKYYEEMQNACLNDKALLSEMWLSDARSYGQTKAYDFNEDITLIGSPFTKGNGAQLSLGSTFAIMANSPSKDACFEFISEFFTDDYMENGRVWAFPSIKKYFTQKLDEAMEDPFYIDENGEKHTYENTMWINNKEIKIPNLTKDERDYLEQYILDAEPSKYIYDNDVSNIINEETQAYFKGERSAEETAKIIQNRVSIIISERS